MDNELSMTQLNKNLCFAAIPDIKTICDDYFGNLDLNLGYFGHVTVFPEGKFHFLASMREWPEYGFAQEQIPPGGYNIYDKLQNSIRLPHVDSAIDIGWSDEVMRISKERFGVENLMIIFRKYADHYQGFFFDLHDSCAYEKYINHFDVFENFIFYYKDKAKDLLRMASQNQLLVPEKFRKANDAKLKVQKNKLLPKQYLLVHNNKCYSISPREYECLSLLAHGKKVKEISRLLNISSRTIETYIVSIKQKLDASSLSEAIEIYWKNRFI